MDQLWGNIAIPRVFPIENTVNFELRHVIWFLLLEHPGYDQIFARVINKVT